MVKARDKASSIQIDEANPFWTDPLSFNPEQTMFKDFPKEVPIKIIANPANVLNAMIVCWVEDLSYISELIQLYMKGSSKIKEAVLPDLFSISGHPEYQSIPVIWSEFRALRQSGLDGYNINQSLKPLGSFRLFPMVEFVNHGAPGCFKIIYDDCVDMVKFLENVKQLDHPCLLSLFSGIHKIEGRFRYLMGYHRMDYEGRKPKAKGGRAPKKNFAILEAVQQFISENPKLKTASTIGERFKKYCKQHTPCIVTVNSRKYEVFYAANNIYSYDSGTPRRKGKYHDKSIAYTTFTARYISEAKKTLNPTKVTNSCNDE